MLAAAQLLWFAQRDVDVAVVEVGAGGRHDATNVADGAVAVVTNDAMDHADLFGPDLEHIAAEKAGIVKPGSIAVVGVSDPDLARPFLERRSAATWRRGTEFGATLEADGPSSLWSPNVALDDVQLGLLAPHQLDNAACALAAVDAFIGPDLSVPAVRAGFLAARHPGRRELVGDPPVLLDAAHNPAGARAATALADSCSRAPPAWSSA